MSVNMHYCSDVNLNLVPDLVASEQKVTFCQPIRTKNINYYAHYMSYVKKKKKKPRKVRRTLFCLLFLYTFLHKAWLRNWSAFGWLALTVCLSCVGDNLKLHLSYRKPILRHWMPISFLNFWAMHSHYCIFTTPHACSSLTDQHVYMQDAYWASRWKYIHLSIFSS